MRQAIIDALEAGTAAVGDVANTAASQQALARSRLHGVVFREIVGFNPADPAALIDAAAQDVEAHRSPRVAAHVVPHAPYSVAPDVLRLLGARAARPGAVCSIHVGESPDEVEFLHTGRGRWRDVLDARGAWNPRWTPPACGPVEYLDRLGVVGPSLLAVHCVQCTDAELARLAEARATIVTCPRSNVWVGVGSPPAARFFASGARVAIGTDSLASASDLNLFSELAALHHLAPGIAPSRLLESATRQRRRGDRPARSRRHRAGRAGPPDHGRSAVRREGRRGQPGRGRASEPGGVGRLGRPRPPGNLRLVAGWRRRPHAGGVHF